MVTLEADPRDLCSVLALSLHNCSLKTDVCGLFPLATRSLCAQHVGLEMAKAYIALVRQISQVKVEPVTVLCWDFIGRDPLEMKAALTPRATALHPALVTFSSPPLLSSVSVPARSHLFFLIPHSTQSILPQWHMPPLTLCWSCVCVFSGPKDGQLHNSQGNHGLPWWASHVTVITGSGQRIDCLKKSTWWGWWETLAIERPPPHHSPFPYHSRKYHISGFSVLHVSFCSSFFLFCLFLFLSAILSSFFLFTASLLPSTVSSSLTQQLLYSCSCQKELDTHSTMLYFVWMLNRVDSLSVGGNVGIELKRDSRVILSVSVMWRLALKLDPTERDVEYESFLCVYKEGFFLLLFCLFLFCFCLNVNFYEQSLMRSWSFGLEGCEQTLPTLWLCV